MEWHAGLQVAQLVDWYGQANSITFDNAQIKAADLRAHGTTPENTAFRSGTSGLGTRVTFNNSPILLACAPLLEPHVALMGYTDPTPENMKGIYHCPNSPYPDCLMNYRQSMNKGLYRFGGKGVSVKDLTDPLTGFTFSTNGNPSIVYRWRRC